MDDSDLSRVWLRSRHPVAVCARRWVQRARRGTAEMPAIAPALDPAWLATFRINSNGAFWELFLAAAFLEAGCSLRPKSRQEGPDLGVALDDGRTLWVEAVSPGPGIPTNPNAVPELPGGITTRVPTDDIVRRLVNALLNKRQKVLSYRRRGIIGASDPAIIAVNGRRAAMYRGDSNPSFIERACLGVGNLQVEFEIGRGAVSSHLTYSPIIDGGERAPVTTLFLEDPRNPRTEISGVIFSMVGMENHAGLRGRSLLHDLLLLPNRAAENPVPPEIALKIATSQLQLCDENSWLLNRMPPLC